MILKLFFISLFLLQTLSCPCSSSDAFPNKQTVDANSIVVSATDRVINNINYGKLIRVGGITILQSSVNISSSINQLSTKCPTGYRAPTIEELIALTNVNASFLVDSMHFETNLYFVSSNKTYPAVTNGADNNAWVFDIIQFSNTAASVSNLSTYWNLAKMRTKCVWDSTETLNVTGNPNRDLEVGKKYSFAVNIPDILAIYWTVGSQTFTTTNVDFTPTSRGCNSLMVKVQLFSGDVVSRCVYLWADVKTKFSNENVTIKDLNIIASRTTGLHFTYGTAPIAPIPAGGAYVLYSDKSNQVLNVLQVDNDLAIVASFNLSVKGRPCDITTFPSGFVILAIDPINTNRMFIQTYDTKGKLLKSRNIMNNGDSPSFNNATGDSRDQLKYYGSDYLPLFGNQAMWKPHNGRLVFGMSRIVAIFAHYNNFGDATNRNDHTGDTMVSFNPDLEDDKVAYSWGASHSLLQQLIYDNTYFVTSALGDAYPMNIRFAITDHTVSNFYDVRSGAYNEISSSSVSNILQGDIPGDGGGQSSGRLGGLIRLSYQGNYGQVYGRIACTAGYQTTILTNKINEIGYVTFDSNLKRTDYVNLLTKNVTSIKSVRYGLNIVIGYSMSTYVGQFPKDTVSEGDTVEFMMIDMDGNILTQPFVFSSSNFLGMTSSDDIESLMNGGLIWSYVNSTGYMFLMKADSPKVDTNIDNPSIGTIQYTTNTRNTRNTGSQSSTNDSSCFVLNLMVFLFVVLFF